VAQDELTGLAAWTQQKDRAAILMAIDGVEIGLSHADIKPDMPAASIKGLLIAQAATKGVRLPVHWDIHQNRDGSWCVGIGQAVILPGFVWPEDETHEPEIPDIKPPDPGAIRPDSGKRK